MTRRIIHIDMDAFYASVEQRDDPLLRGKPVIVGGRPGGRGVVSAASYEAREFGIHSAMPSGQAQRLCPHGIFIRGDFAKYRSVSRQMRAILKRYATQIEPVSLDECYLDVTELPDRFSSATDVARDIRSAIHNELGLTASAGVAPLKFVAKIASDFHKPDGLTVVHPSKLFDFLFPLPVGKIPGVGPVTRQKLEKMDIVSIGDLAALSELEATRTFGKHGIRLWKLARGIDNRSVSASRRRKSRGAERTFPADIDSREELVIILRTLATKVCEDIKKERLLARTVNIKVRHADFTTLTRSSTLISPTDDESLVADVAITLLTKAEPLPPVRLLGVSVANFTYPDSPRQLSLGL